MKEYGFIDLHMHSEHSHEKDVNITVAGLLDIAQERAMETGKECVISITDHNSTLSATEAKEILAKNKEKYSMISFISGVEMSVRLDELGKSKSGNSIFSHCHMLGYGYDESNEKLKAYSKITHYIVGEDKNFGQQIMATRNILCEMFDVEIDLLDLLPLIKTVSIDEIKEKFVETVVSKYNLNREKVEKVASKVFVNKKLEDPKIISKSRLKISEASKLICDAGGKCSIAHPSFIYYYVSEIGKLEKKKEIFADFLKNCQYVTENRISGIEVFYKHGTKDGFSNILYNIAKENNLYITCGSDYHGPILRPNIKIGYVFSNGFNAESLKEFNNAYPVNFANNITSLKFVDDVLNHKNSSKKYDFELNNVAKGKLDEGQVVEILNRVENNRLQIKLAEHGNNIKDNFSAMIEPLKQVNSSILHITKSSKNFDKKQFSLDKLISFVNANIKQFLYIKKEIKDLCVSDEEMRIILSNYKKVVKSIRANMITLYQQQASLIYKYKKEQNIKQLDLLKLNRLFEQNNLKKVYEMIDDDFKVIKKKAKRKKSRKERNEKKLRARQLEGDFSK